MHITNLLLLMLAPMTVLGTLGCYKDAAVDSKFFSSNFKNGILTMAIQLDLATVEYVIKECYVFLNYVR